MSTLFTLLLFVSFACPQNGFDIPRGYHKFIGIPAAQRLKAQEDAIHSQDTSRIYRGYPADIKKFPFFAGLVIYFKNITDYSICGAALVSSTRLLTAGQCWDDEEPGHIPDRMTVVLGSEFMFSGGQRIETKEVYQHPEYNAYSSEANDIAVICLPYKVNFSSTIFPVALPRKGELVISVEGYVVTTVGLGVNEGEYQYPANRSLKAVDLKIISDAECIQNFRVRAPGILCTSGKVRKGICYGDSGSPLIAHISNHRVLIGIAVALVPGQGCGAETPAAFTRISSYINFIESHVTHPNFTFKYERHEFITVEEDGVTASHSSVRLVS